MKANIADQGTGGRVMPSLCCPNGHTIVTPADHRDCFLAADRANLPALMARDPQAGCALARSIARREKVA